VFNNEEEQAKKEENATKNEQIEVSKDNQLFIILKEYSYSCLLFYKFS
jgi:hypothetical protein